MQLLKEVTRVINGCSEYNLQVAGCGDKQAKEPLAKLQPITPKAFANSSPGLLQPWDKVFNKYPNSERVSELIAALRQHFQRWMIPTSFDPRVEATLGWN